MQTKQFARSVVLPLIETSIASVLLYAQCRSSTYNNLFENMYSHTYVGNTSRETNLRRSPLGPWGSHDYNAPMIFSSVPLAAPFTSSSSFLRRFASPPFSLRTLGILSVLLATLTLSAPSRAAKSGDEKKGSPKKDDVTESSNKTEPASGDVASEEIGATATGAGAATGASAAIVPGGPGNTIVFFEVGLRADLGTFKQTSEVGRRVDEEITDVKSLGPMFHFGALARISDRFRVGGAFGYGMNYKLVERPTAAEKDNDNFEPDEFRFGQLLTLDARLEFAQPLTPKIFLTVTPRLGVSVIQVGEDLREVTDELEGSHNISKPRLGFLGGADLGMRYQFTPWFGLRGTFGYAFSAQSYLNATRSGDTLDSDRSWSSSVSRLSGNIASEVSF